MDGRAKLRKFLDDKDLSQADFCRLSGFSTGQLSDYLSDDAVRQRRPGLEHAHAIAVLTSGAVPTDSWLTGEEKKSIAKLAKRAA